MEFKTRRSVFLFGLPAGFALLFLLALFFILPGKAALATSYHAITVDGDLSDWEGDEILETDSDRTVYLTWDSANLYLGLELPTGEYLGDDASNKSFFVAIDTDMTNASGAAADGYGNVTFTSPYLPEVIYYYAGGVGWYEWSSWNGSGWDWQGWSDAGTYYDWDGNPGLLPGTELTIPLANLGNPDEIAVIAWLTPESGSNLESSWPTANPIGTAPLLSTAYFFTLEEGVPPSDSVDNPRINEIRADQTSTDNDEYFELFGVPGTPLEGLTYLVLGDTTEGVSGVIENVTSLNGYSITASGYFVAAESTFTLGTADLTTTLNFENTDNVTHLLVRNFTGSNGQDLDTNDDGILDVTPWTELVDLIALILQDNPPTSTEYHYGPPTVGPDGSYAPAQAYFCQAGWQIGSFDIGITDTPGAVNPCIQQSVTKTGPALLQAGETITYTITYQNSGVDDAAAVFLSDTLPAEISYQSDNSGLACAACQIGATGTFTWQIGTLAAGISETFVMTGWITDTAPYGLALINTIAITSTSLEADLSNNEDDWKTTVSPLDLIVTKTGPAVGIAGEALVYNIQIENVGITTATHVIITDTLPISVTGVISSSSALTATQSTTQTIWEFGDLISGTAETIVLTVTVDAAAPSGLLLTNQAEAATETPGDNPANNQDQVTTTIYQIVPIAAARAGNNGDIFAVEGQVIYTPGTFNLSGWALQDASGGIGVYYSAPPAIALHDKVRLIATRGDFNGEEQFTTPLYLFENLGPGPVVTPTAFSTADVAAGLSEGWLAKAEGFVSGLGGCTGNYQFSLDDGSGPATIYVDADTGVDVCTMGVVDGAHIKVTGFSTEYNGQFEIKPRFPADIDLDYVIDFVYHDLEDVVYPGESVQLTLSDTLPIALTLTPNGDSSQFSGQVILDEAGAFPYQYAVIPDPLAGTLFKGWLQSSARSINVTDLLSDVSDYRNVAVSQAANGAPLEITILLGENSGPVTASVEIGGGTRLWGRGLKADLGFGELPNSILWTEWEAMTYTGSDYDAESKVDLFSGIITPTLGGIYSYNLRADGNWGVGNPNAAWTYGDVRYIGRLVVQAPTLTASKSVTPTLEIEAGDRLTYAIQIANGSEEWAIAASAVLTDVLPAEVEVLEATLPEGMAYDAKTHTLTWSGAIARGATQLLAFDVIVKEDLAAGLYTFTNTALIHDGFGTVLTAESEAIIFEIPEGYFIFLPVIVLE